MGWGALLGASPGPFLVLTVAFFGAAAVMTGQALGRNWRPAWQAVPYALLLGIGDRFLLYALFDGALVSPSGYALCVAILLALCLLARRAALARLMVRQYPWLYERAGPLGWQARR